MRLGSWVVKEPDLPSTGRGFESRPPCCREQPWASCLHTCASVSKQYNLVPANRQWCLVAGEVNTGLTESNGSLLLGLWLQLPAGWLPRTGIGSGTLRSFRVWDYLYLTCYDNTCVLAGRCCPLKSWERRHSARLPSDSRQFSCCMSVQVGLVKLMLLCRVPLFLLSMLLTAVQTCQHFV